MSEPRNYENDMAQEIGRLRSSEKELLKEKDNYRTLWQKALEGLTAANERVKTLEAEFPTCEKHAPKAGGHRSGCLICGMMEMSAALSKIDYLCGEPNEMQVSGYDLHCDPPQVVEAVKVANERVERLRRALEEIRQVATGEEQVADDDSEALGWINRRIAALADLPGRGDRTDGR